MELDKQAFKKIENDLKNYCSRYGWNKWDYKYQISVKPEVVLHVKYEGGYLNPSITMHIAGDYITTAPTVSDYYTQPFNIAIWVVSTLQAFKDPARFSTPEKGLI